MMKKIALKPIAIPLPRNIEPPVRESIEKAVADMRDNMQLLEAVINTLIDKENENA